MITFTICCVLALAYAVFTPVVCLVELLFCGVGYMLTGMLYVIGWLIEAWFELPTWVRWMGYVAVAVWAIGGALN